MLIRMQNVVQSVLQYAEDKEAGEADRDRREAAKHRLVRINVEVAEFPSATPITNYCRRSYEGGEYCIQDRQNGIV